MEPFVKDAASKAEPAAKDFTEGQLKPAADTVAEKAVPVTKKIGEGGTACILALPSYSSPYGHFVHVYAWTLEDFILFL